MPKVFKLIEGSTFDSSIFKGVTALVETNPEPDKHFFTYNLILGTAGIRHGIIYCADDATVDVTRVATQAEYDMILQQISSNSGKYQGIPLT